MQKLIITSLIALFSLAAMAQEERKVAVFDPAGNADNAVKEIVREVISSVVVNTYGYTVLERQLIDRVLAENRFQMGGFVDDAQISEMGRMIGANLVFVTSVITMDNNFFVSGKIVDVQTARIEMQRTTETQNGTRDLVAVVQRLTADILGQQPVTQAAPPAAQPPRQTQTQTPPPQTVPPAARQQITVAGGTPLISVGRNVYQFERQMNQGEFNRFMELKSYRYMTALSTNQVHSLMTVYDNLALPAYNRGISNHNIGNWLLTSGWLGIILKSQGSMQIREAVYLYNSEINRTDVSQMLFNFNYEKGKKRNRTGNVLLWSGVGVAITSIPIFSLYSEHGGENESSINGWAFGLGMACWIGGVAMVYTGISLKISGKYLMREHVDLHYGGSRAGMELDFGFTGNGARAALRF